MTTLETIDIPPDLLDAIRQYMAAGKHGNITLNVKNGQIVSWSLTEIGRIDKGKDCPVA